MPSGDAIYLIIAGTFFGFIGLAFVLLYPVYRFLRRQEHEADEWTPDAIVRRTREMQAREAQARESGGAVEDGP